MSTLTYRNSSSSSASTSTSLSTPTKSNKTSFASTNTSPSPTTSSSASTATTPSPSKPTQISKLSPSTFETLLDNVHKTAKETAKQDSTAEEVVLAKLACYAVRELHAEGVYPITALRAMAILEFTTKKRSTGGAIKQAKREVRDEHQVLRERRARDNMGCETDGAEDGEIAGGAVADEGFDGEGEGGFSGDDGFGGATGMGEGMGDEVLVQWKRD